MKSRFFTRHILASRLPGSGWLVATAWAIGLTFFGEQLLPQAIGVLLITALLPGALWVELLVPRAVNLSLAERALYAIGLGYAHLVIVLLALSYLPGGLPQRLVVGTFGGLLIALLVGRRGTGYRAPTPEQIRVSPRISASKYLPLLALLLIGGLFRFTHLGYSEFQGDEATVLLRAADAIAGREDALTSHLKGPVEILLPTAIYALTGRIDEATARFPFALANLVGLVAIWQLGLVLFGINGASPRSTSPQPSPAWGGSRGWADEGSAPPLLRGRLGGGLSSHPSVHAINRPPSPTRGEGAGGGGALLAPLLLALDGYFIAFSRIVQYQSVVFLMTTLTLLALIQVERGRLPLRRGLLLAALFLATGLLAHYEAGLVALPGAYLLWRIGRRRSKHGGWADFARAMVAPLSIGTALLAAFYVPFVRHPAFGTTLAYITVNRIGVDQMSSAATFPYNNLADVFARTTLYSSLYHVALWVTLLLAALIWLVVRRARGVARWSMLALLMAGAVVAWALPGWAWLVFALAVAAAWILAERTGERVAWLWFGGPLLLSIFFIRQPNTHVYGFFMGAALVAGEMAAQIWRWLRDHRRRVIAVFAALGVTALLGLQANYAYLYFVQNRPEILRTWVDNRPPGYPVFYEMPTTRSIFGFPLRNGWQAIGHLYERGQLDGPFATNAKAPVADWYVRGLHRCDRNPRYFIFADTVEPADDIDLLRERREIEQTHRFLGAVHVRGQQRLLIYTQDKIAEVESTAASNNPALPNIWWEYIRDDGFAAPLAEPQLLQQGVVAEQSAAAAVKNRLNFQFGESITLLGYTLPQQAFAPGERVPLTLFWQANEPVGERYAATVQLVGFESGDKIGQLDGEPACGQAPTSGWLAGDTVADVYSISLAADAAPGRYRVLVALYERDTGTRLPIATADGQPVGDALGIDEIRVK